MEQNGFLNASWAEEFQQHMRQRKLTDSGRLLSPVLRPCFVTQRQADVLAKTATQLSSIFDRLAEMIITRPPLLRRLQILPAERSLLAVKPGHKHFSMAGSFDVAFRGSACSITGVDACRPVGLGYAAALADVFLELPIVREFQQHGQKVAKVPGPRKIEASLTTAWREFGGKGKPSVAVVDWAHNGSDGASEGELLADRLAAQGIAAQFTPPEKLVFQNGELSAGGRKIDVVLRRILVRELLTRWDLSHPLLEAYRARAVCMVNSLWADLGQRRAFLELLSDESLLAELPAPDRKLLKQTVRWTRVLSPRHVQHNGKDEDLLDFVLKNREHLLLLPDQPSTELRTYAGSQMTTAAWEWAIRQALRTPYVVQECEPAVAETFPFFQYGELKLRSVDVTVQAQMLDGELGDCMAVLHSKTAGSITPLGIAPVLLFS